MPALGLAGRCRPVWPEAIEQLEALLALRSKSLDAARLAGPVPACRPAWRLFAVAAFAAKLHRPIDRELAANHSEHDQADVGRCVGARLADCARRLLMHHDGCRAARGRLEVARKVGHRLEDVCARRLELVRGALAVVLIDRRHDDVRDRILVQVCRHVSLIGLDFDARRGRFRR